MAGTFSDPSGCAGCPTDSCSLKHQAPQDMPMSGVPFMAVSVLVFLLPILLAILGAAWFKDSYTHQFFGGTAGFLFGMTLGVILRRGSQTRG